MSFTRGYCQRIALCLAAPQSSCDWPHFQTRISFHAKRRGPHNLLICKQPIRPAKCFDVVTLVGISSLHACVRKPHANSECGRASRRCGNLCLLLKMRVNEGTRRTAFCGEMLSDDPRLLFPNTRQLQGTNLHHRLTSEQSSNL